jgi:uncharacterized HAD superfamily protein
MVIGWDLDGVLYPWHEHVLDYAKEYMGTPKDCTLEGFFGPEGLFHTWPDLAIQNILKIPIFYEKSPIVKSKLEILNRLAKEHELVYITSRPPEAEFVTELWVKGNHLPFSHNLYVVNGSKQDLVSSLDISYFIDDRPTVVKELHDIVKVILYTRPWNYKYEEPNDVLRIQKLEEVEEIVNGTHKEYTSH